MTTPVSRIEQRLFKVCLTPNRSVDPNMYTPSKIHQVLKALQVDGIRQIYIPGDKALGHASIIFNTAVARDEFLNTYTTTGVPLTPIATDTLLVTPWYSSDERERYQTRQGLSRVKGFFCKQVPKNLTSADLIEHLPNSDKLCFIRTMTNTKNNNTMACFCYNTCSDAEDFVILASTGFFRITIDGTHHDIRVEPYHTTVRAKHIKK